MLPDPFHDVLTANEQYADSFDLAGLTPVAARGLAIVTCIDSRIAPLDIFGLAPGDAKILRNAGARVTDDVLRTLVIATNLLGVERIAVVGHTDCAAAGITEPQMRAQLAEHHPMDLVERRSYLVTEDQHATQLADLIRIREDPLIPASVALVALHYDVATGIVHRLVDEPEPQPQPELN